MRPFIRQTAIHLNPAMNPLRKILLPAAALALPFTLSSCVTYSDYGYYSPGYYSTGASYCPPTAVYVAPRPYCPPPVYSPAYCPPVRYHGGYYGGHSHYRSHGGGRYHCR